MGVQLGVKYATTPFGSVKSLKTNAFDRRSAEDFAVTICLPVPYRTSIRIRGSSLRLPPSWRKLLIGESALTIGSSTSRLKVELHAPQTPALSVVLFPRLSGIMWETELAFASSQ